MACGEIALRNFRSLNEFPVVKKRRIFESLSNGDIALHITVFSLVIYGLPSSKSSSNNFRPCEESSSKHQVYYFPVHLIIEYDQTVHDTNTIAETTFVSFVSLFLPLEIIL